MSAASRHGLSNATDTARIVKWVEGVPAAALIGFHPGIEIHGAGSDFTPMSEIAVAITRRDIQAAAERDGKVREIATTPTCSCIAWAAVRVERASG